MKPTRILTMLTWLAVPIFSTALTGCYIQPPVIYPASYPIPRPPGATARRATPPGLVNYNNPNPYGGGQQAPYGGPPPPYPYDPNGVNSNQYGGNPPPGYGSNPPPYEQSAGDPNAGNPNGDPYGMNAGNPTNVGDPGSAGGSNGGGNPNGDPYGNGAGGSVGSGPAPAPPVAPSQATCAQGYVWREASSADFVCVTPDARAQAAYDNSQASARLAGGGGYGPDTCLQGYVWREAFAGDHVCVTPQTRSQTASDNSLANSRQGGSSSSMPNYNRKYILHNLP
jgi:hypothetical protein